MHWAVILAVVAAVTVVGLAVVPIPGECNVQVTVNLEELSLFLANYFQVNSITPTNDGHATVLDFSAWGLNIGPPALQATFTGTACAGSHCASKSESQWFTTVPILNGQQLTATDTITIGYVPVGTTPVTFTLSQSGYSAPVATASSSLLVGC